MAEIHTLKNKSIVTINLELICKNRESENLME